MTVNLINIIGVPTDQEIVDWARTALIQVLATGQAYGIDGRSLTRATPDDLRAIISEYEGRIETAEAGTSGSKENFARFRRPV